jgi:four helix bundle protein
MVAKAPKGVKVADKEPKGFRKLIVWQRAHGLVLQVYTITEKFPKSEVFGLISQMRRCAVSVSANIAEGYASGAQGQFGRYLKIAQGSLAELEYYFILVHDLGYLSAEAYAEAEQLRAEVGYLLHRLIQKVQS